MLDLKARLGTYISIKQELSTAVKARQQARKAVEKDPSATNRIIYNKCTAKVRLLSNTAKRKNWRETCSKLDLNKDGKKAWGLLHNLEGSKRKENPKPFNSDGEKIFNEKQKANHLNKYLAGVSKSTRRRVLDRALWSFHKKKLKASSCNDQPFEQEFSI